MRRFRQIVLLWLVSLLSAGPAFAALTASGCMARQATCPMCAHGTGPVHSQPTPCAGDRGMGMHALQPQRVVEPAALHAVSELACLCSGQQNLRTLDMQVVPKLDRTRIAAPIALNAGLWPLAQRTVARAPSQDAVAVDVRRLHAPLLLRV